MDVLDVDNCLLIGRIAKPHGLRGECKVIPETDDPDRFTLLKEVLVGPAAESARLFSVTGVRMQHSGRGVTVLLRLHGVTTKEEAAALSRSSVFVRPADLPPLQEDEFFLHDVIGLSVLTEDGETIGVVRDIWEMPASNVYVVTRPGRRDALIPAVPAFIDRVDVAGERLIVRPIEGLLD